MKLGNKVNLNQNTYSQLMKIIFQLFDLFLFVVKIEVKKAKLKIYFLVSTKAAKVTQI